MPGKPWYNNGIIEIQCGDSDIIPDGFSRGRLPVSDDTRRKHSQNNGIHKLSKEQEQRRREKISTTKQNKSEEEKKLYSQHISDSRKGKGVGITPWNKGKRGLQTPWNKGITYTLDDIKRANMVSKRYNTQKENGTLGINQDTKAEIEYYNYLLSIYDRDDIVHPYIDKTRYPFKCDFYIKSEDLFIEVHANWTHGGHPFDPMNLDDIYKLENWKEKSKTSDYYKNAIYQWTDLDVRKVETARKNNLNFIVVYSN